MACGQGFIASEPIVCCLLDEGWQVLTHIQVVVGYGLGDGWLTRKWQLDVGWRVLTYMPMVVAAHASASWTWIGVGRRLSGATSVAHLCSPR